MGAKPSDLLIGIAELVGVLLPGAVVAFAARPLLVTIAKAYSLPVPSDAAGWVAFAVVAYFTGHLVFLFGSFLDMPYDHVRQRLWPRERDEAYSAANGIRLQVLGVSARATNTYKFATALLALHHETAYAEVRQLEADSKFFRSLAVLAIGLFVASVVTGQAIAALSCAAVASLCCWRYIERRWKATQRAFQYVVVLNAIDADVPPNLALQPTPTKTRMSRRG